MRKNILFNTNSIFNGVSTFNITLIILLSFSLNIPINAQNKFDIQQWTGAWGSDGFINVGDLNGDGKTDVFMWKDAIKTWTVNISNGTGFTMQAWAGWGTSAKVYTGFLNNDRKTDVFFWDDMEKVWRVNLSTGSGFEKTTWTGAWGSDGPINVGDLNKDKKTDVFMWRDSDKSWMVNLSTGSGFTMQRWTGAWGSDGPIKVADLNGDEMDDVFMWRNSDKSWTINLSTGSGFTMQRWTGAWGSDGEIHIGDLNGDKKTDVFMWRDAEGWQVNLSTGTGFTNEKWVGACKQNYTSKTGDFNGDGKTDIAIWKDVTKEWMINFSTGYGFKIETYTGAWGSDGPIFTGYLNDDRKADIFMWRGSDNTWMINLSNPLNTFLALGLPSRFSDCMMGIQGIEVTQSIQNILNDVPVVAGKTTWARVYIQTGLNRQLRFNGLLRIHNQNTGISVTVPSNAAATIDPAFDKNLEHKRNSLLESLNFVIPPTFNTEGTCSFSLLSITDEAGNQLACPDCNKYSTNVTFIKAPTLRLRIIGLQYSITTAATPGHPQTTQTFSPSARDFALLRSWLTRAYPVANVSSTQLVATSSDDWPFTCQDANTQLAALRSADINNNISDRRTHYISLVSDGTNGNHFMRGCANLPGFVASSPTGPSWSGDNDGSYGDWYGGHELAHNYGRKHPGFCGGNSKDDSNYPFPNGQISSATKNFIGLDVGDAANGIATTIIPVTAFDIMTYCDQPQWLSSYTYINILNSLKNEDPSISGSSGNGGIATIKPIAGEFISLIASVNRTKRIGSIKFINRVSKILPEAKDESSTASILINDRQGHLLGQFPVTLKHYSDNNPGDDEIALVDAVLPYQENIGSIELILAGNIIDRRIVSKNIPYVSNLRIDSTERNAGFSVHWDGKDVDNDPLTYMIQLRSVEGIWETVAIGYKLSTITLSPMQLNPKKWNSLRVIANDGFHSSTPAEISMQVY